MFSPRIALGRAIGALFVRASEHAASLPSASPGAPIDLVELAARLYATIDAQDWTHLPDLVSPHLEVRHGAGGAIDWKHWRSKLAAFYVAFPDGQHLIDEVVTDGDRVVTRGRFIGTHVGVFHGAAPTGRRVEIAVVHVDRFRDGLLQSHFGLLEETALPH